MVIIALFTTLAMGLATLSVHLFGTPGGNNTVWNLGGVLTGLALTVALVRQVLSRQPWMAAARYSWQLKRNLMRVTNCMHLVEAGVAAANPSAIKLLRFYHLGLTEMHWLDGNDTGLAELAPQRRALETRMQALGIPLEQSGFDPDWLTRLQDGQ
jgi:hypothetical protein